MSGCESCCVSKYFRGSLYVCGRVLSCGRVLKVFGRLCDEGCSVLVCPGAKSCSWLQSFALRGSAECRWDRGESSQTEVPSRWGRETRKRESESGCALVKTVWLMVQTESKGSI